MSSIFPGVTRRNRRRFLLSPGTVRVRPTVTSQSVLLRLSVWISWMTYGPIRNIQGNGDVEEFSGVPSGNKEEGKPPGK